MRRKWTEGHCADPNGRPRLKALFAASPNPYILIDPTLEIVAMNDAYLRVTMRQRADLVGRNIFAHFQAIRNRAVTGSCASFERVVGTGLPDHIPLIQYSIPSPMDAASRNAIGAPAIRPSRDDGSVAYILQHTVDVTELQRLRSLASDAQVYGKWRRSKPACLPRRSGAAPQRATGGGRAAAEGAFRPGAGLRRILSGPDHVLR